MKIFLIVLLSLFLLLMIAFMIVCYLLFSLACAKKIPKIIAPVMNGLIGGFHIEDIDMVKEGKSFFESEPKEDWYTDSFDGLRLHAAYIPCKDARATIVLFHGYRSGALHDFSAVLPYYRALGLNILMCDQRAHGESEGKYVTFGVLEKNDVISWTQEHNRRVGADTPIILDGISMGGSTVAFASSLALPANVKGIIDDCGYSSPELQIHYVMGLMKIPVFPFYHVADAFCSLFGRFSFSEVDARKCLANTNVPCLFLHGETDDFVLCNMGRDCYESCSSKKKIFICPGAGHGMSYLTETDKCKKLLSDFIDDVLSDVTDK